MKRRSFDAADCPVARALDAVGDWWSLLIVRDAFAGASRFGEFRASLGVATNILTARLRKLVAHGVLEVVPAADGSAYPEYALTVKGRGLYLVLAALRQWGEGCLFDRGQPGSRLVDRARGEPVRPLELRAADGRVLGPEDVRVAARPGRRRGRPNPSRTR